MNQLSLEKRAKILNLLVEGTSLRACARIENISITTVLKLFVEVGQACIEFHDTKVVDLETRRIQCDEIWSFINTKEKNIKRDGEKLRQSKIGKVGDAWTWIALDADTKLVIDWLVGRRNTWTAKKFMYNLAPRLKSRVQMTTDGFKAYYDSVTDVFRDQIDFAQLVKKYGRDEFDENGNRDNRVKYQGADKKIISGNPDHKHIHTSYIERQNLTMRTHISRFARRTNAFSKKLENHNYHHAIYYVYYNFVRTHSSMDVPPAVKAEIIETPMTLKDIVILADEMKKKSN